MKGGITSNRLQNGSTLVTSLVLMVVLTTALLASLQFLYYHNKFVLRKSGFLAARNNAEVALVMKTKELQIAPLDMSGFPISTPYHASGKDTSSAILEIWGGYLNVKSEYLSKENSYTLNALVGTTAPRGYDSAISLSPDYYSLVVTGATKVTGDLHTGKSGIKSESFRGCPYAGSAPIYGKVVVSSSDPRPVLDQHYMDELFSSLRSELYSPADLDFQDLISDSTQLVTLPAQKQTIHASANVLRENVWQIKGPGTIVVNEPLTIDRSLQFSRFVRILCADSVVIADSVNMCDVILYSQGPIAIQGIKKFDGQIFSESDISVSGTSILSYPSNILLYGDQPNSWITIQDSSSVSGTIAYANANTAIKAQHRSGISIGPNTIVDGIVYSQNLVTLEGTVNGNICTERFYFYYSPTHYYNWINGGIVNRWSLSEEFKVPLYFASAESNLELLFYW